MTMRPRGVVPDVLLMPAFQFGNPIQLFIQMKVDDSSQRPRDFYFDRFHGCLSQWRDLSRCSFVKVPGVSWSEPDTQRDGNHDRVRSCGCTEESRVLIIPAFFSGESRAISFAT
jgi:hypothetical protein